MFKNTFYSKAFVTSLINQLSNNLKDKIGRDYSSFTQMVKISSYPDVSDTKIKAVTTTISSIYVLFNFYDPEIGLELMQAICKNSLSIFSNMYIANIIDQQIIGYNDTVLQLKSADKITTLN